MNLGVEWSWPLSTDWDLCDFPTVIQSHASTHTIVFTCHQELSTTQMLVYLDTLLLLCHSHDLAPIEVGLLDMLQFSLPSRQETPSRLDMHIPPWYPVPRWMYWYYHYQGQEEDRTVPLQQEPAQSQVKGQILHRHETAAFCFCA